MRRRGIGRVGRPSLVGTAARTAVIAGTATAVAGGVAGRQQAKAQQAAGAQQMPASPPPTPTLPTSEAAPPVEVTDDVVEQLKKLAELRDAGILTEDEFTAKKSKLLGI